MKPGKEILLIGGGHSNIQVLKSLAQLKKRKFRVTLISDVPLSPYSGMIPSYMAGVYAFKQLHFDLARICHRYGFRFIENAVTSIDAKKNHEYKFKTLLWLKLNSIKNKQSTFISVLNNYNHNFITSIETEIQKLSFELSVDYDGKITEWINKNYQINTNNPFSSDFKIENLYGALLTEYSIEEVDIADESVRSVLFFEGNESLIKAYLEVNFPKHKDEEPSGNDGTTVAIGNIINASLTKDDKQINLNESSNGKGGWLYSGHSDKAKGKKGKSAEQLVYNTFVQKFGIENVKWVSGNSNTPDKNDKLHYDIEYKNEKGEWKYLEVKAISDNYFIISSSEKKQGLSEPNKYEMALVKDDNIYIVESLFHFKKGERFDSNSKFVAHAKDYIFTFNLNDIITK